MQNISHSGAVGLDEAGAKELATIRANLAKQKVKLGKEFDNYVVDEADWVGGDKKYNPNHYCARLVTVTGG